MNRLLALFIAFFLLNNCSFNENSRIWKEKDKDLSKKENVKKIFAEEEVKASEFNQEVKLNLSGLRTSNKIIDNTNNNLINGIDGFLRDAFGSVSDIGGGMTSMFSKLGNIKGSLTSALNFENIKMNVFPFELSPNPAVSDYYTLCDGGGAQTQSSLPSPMGMEKAANKHINKISQLAKGQKYVDTFKQPAFGEPDKSTADVDLTEGGVQSGGVEDSFTQDEIDEAVADESEFNMF